MEFTRQAFRNTTSGSLSIMIELPLDRVTEAIESWLVFISLLAQQGKSQKLWSFPKFSPSSIVSGSMVPNVSGNSRLITAPNRANNPKIVSGSILLNRALQKKISSVHTKTSRRTHEIDNIRWDDCSYVAGNVNVGLNERNNGIKGIAWDHAQNRGHK